MNIKVYSKTTCPFCTLAKKWLTAKGYVYEEILLDDDNARQKFYEEYKIPVKTVPQIYVDGERIGGYQELVQSHLAVNLDLKEDF